MYWATGTDDIRLIIVSITQLTDALEALVKRGKESDTTGKFPNSVSDITVTY